MKTLTQLIDHGLEIRASITRLEEELDRIETAIQALALEGEQHDLEDPDRDGKQFLAAGSTHTVPVILTADILAQSFADNSVMHGRAAAIAGDALPRLYRPVTIHKMLPRSGKTFRREAAALLGPDVSAELITAVTARDKHGIAKSAIKIEWSRATPNP